MATEKCLGWTNYETWLMNVNLTNEEGIYTFIVDLASRIKDDYELAEALKVWLEDNYFLDDVGIFKLCDAWTHRNFQEVNFIEIAKSLRDPVKEAQLRVK
jgi:hypothetical protein